MKSIMHLLLLLLFLLLLVTTKPTNASRCIGKERDALFDLKANLKDPQGLLSSWRGLNCCSWYGVTCDNRTGYVTMLELGNNKFGKSYALTGDISPSLIHLTHLEYLNLHGNDFGGANIPEFIGSLKNLRHLDLLGAEFGGKIPPQLGNLSKLNYLDIGFPKDHFTSTSSSVDNLRWLSGLSSLAYLDMSWWNLSAASDWLESLNMLASLQELHLGATNLPPTNLNSLPQSNFTVLNTIDLSGNNFSSTFPNWLTLLQTMSSINLGGCGLHGLIPEAVGNLTALSNLQLYMNSLEGAIPTSIGRLCNLKILVLTANNLVGDIGNLGTAMAGCMKELYMIRLGSNNISGSLSGWFGSFRNLSLIDLSHNSLSGPVPSNISELTNLNELDLSYNYFQGVLSEEHLANLSMLSRLVLSFNSLRISVGSNWTPPFQLYELKLRSCPLDLPFPQWLQAQTGMETLDLHNTGTIGALPDWLWTSLASLTSLVLSDNRLTGKLPASLVQMKSLQFLGLGSNRLEGQIPSMPERLQVLNLSNNSFSGPLPHTLGGNSLNYIFLSNNRLNGRIPIYFCGMASLFAIDLSSNSLSGKLFNCWKQRTSLLVIDFSNNKLEGEIPSSIGSLTSLFSLHLHSNRLSGVLPSSLRSLNLLLFLDLGENYLEGSIPVWIGESLQALTFLRLRSNHFYGNIPVGLSQLEDLLVLDLANNKLSGALPQSIGSFTRMASDSRISVPIPPLTLAASGVDEVFYDESMYITIKGAERLYYRILYLMKSIDLSNNALTGNIPSEVGALMGLKNLNLSRNHLSGHIPETIANMSSLDSLDLSWNQLSGGLPQSMASLHLLSHLNLSYNNLSGKIPSGSQLQTLVDEDPYIFAGNNYLCSPLVPDGCSEHKGNPVDHDEHTDGRDVLLFVFSGLGFGIGFASVWWLLIFSKTVSTGYFQSVDSVCEKICEWIILLKIKVIRKLVGRNQNTGD